MQTDLARWCPRDPRAGFKPSEGSTHWIALWHDSHHGLPVHLFCRGICHCFFPSTAFDYWSLMLHFLIASPQTNKPVGALPCCTATPPSPHCPNCSAPTLPHPWLEPPELGCSGFCEGSLVLMGSAGSRAPCSAGTPMAHAGEFSGPEQEILTVTPGSCSALTLALPTAESLMLLCMALREQPCPSPGRADRDWPVLGKKRLFLMGRGSSAPAWVARASPGLPQL